MRLFVVLMFSLLAACSTRVTGPVTGREYNVNIGCTDDMEGYTRERDEVLGKNQDNGSGDVETDCPATSEPPP